MRAIIPATLIGLWLPPAPQSAQLPASQKVNADRFTSSEVCAECHQAIHAVWQESMHSRAFENCVFQAAYRTARREASKAQAELCLRCHAPTVRQTGDFAAADPITRQGVTCDFCHSIRGVDLDAPDRQIDVVVGSTKYGPLQHAQSPAHTIVDSPLHRRSELCAPCHEYRNEYGVAILETYSEWKAGPYARQGKQCQDCHMPLVPGRVVAAGIDAPPRAGVNLHNVSGSHDQEKVRKAVTMEILSVVWLGAKSVRVRVKVANVGSGHSFPTGLPQHRAVLELTLTDRGQPVQRRSIAFEKVLMNSRGLPITREHEFFLDARSVRNDTRIKPKESRIVSVTLSDVDAPDGRINASLWYQYATHVVRLNDGVETFEPTEMKFLLASDQQRLPRFRR